jgi:predicted aspartyl protease
MIRYQHNQQVVPPAPFVHATLSRIDDVGASLTMPALIDTGADTTVVPVAVVDELELLQVAVVEAAGLGHVTAMINVYVIRISVHQFPAVTRKVLAVPGEQHILLGRDILNLYRITLDGPRALCIFE